MEALTSHFVSFIKVDVIEIVFVTSSLRIRRGAVQLRNRQDAREGGEIPPLPRNCDTRTTPGLNFEIRNVL